MSTTTKAAHTPGPWEADGCKDGGNRYHQIDGPNFDRTAEYPYTVADTSNRHHCISLEEDAANARLISAAPKMLEALEDVAAMLPVAGRLHQDDLFKLQSRVVAAIQKARGGQ